jgi:hypothetical protein
MKTPYQTLKEILKTLQEDLQKYDDANLPHKPTKAQMNAWEKGRKPLEKKIEKAKSQWIATRPKQDNGLADFLEDENA